MILETLLSLLSGGALRVLPEIMTIWNKKSDYAHELAMMDKQLELQKSKAADDRETMQLHGSIDETLALLAAQKDALVGQMQKTNVWIVDCLNFLVRPLTTYYFLTLYGLVKLAMFVLAVQSGISGWEAILKLYDADDRNMLSGVIGFWFLGRCFDKRK